MPPKPAPQTISNQDIAHLLAAFGFKRIQIPLGDKAKARFLIKMRDQLLASPSARNVATICYEQPRNGRRALEANTLQYTLLALLIENGKTARDFVAPLLSKNINDVDRAAYLLKEKGYITRPERGTWETTEKGKVALLFAELQDMAVNPTPTWPKARAYVRNIRISLTCLTSNLWEDETESPYFINHAGHQYVEDAVQTRLLLALWEHNNKQLAMPSASPTAKQYMPLASLAKMTPGLREQDLRSILRLLSSKTEDSLSLIELKIGEGFCLNVRGKKAVEAALAKAAPAP